MLRLNICGTELRLRALTILMAALMCVMGDFRELISVLVALFAHESAHMIAAKCCGLKISHIDIMPFGGMARVIGINSASARKTLPVALAGPAANALLAACGGALGWLGALDFLDAARTLRVNAILLLFNLLPALPLDGGRAMLAISGLFIDRRAAVKILVTIAHVIAFALIGFSIYGFFAMGVLNITFLLVAVFLFAGSLDDMRAMLESDASDAVRALVDEKPLPRKARLVAMEDSTPAASASSHISPDELTIFAIIGDDDIRLVSEREIARRALE